MEDGTDKFVTTTRNGNLPDPSLQTFATVTAIVPGSALLWGYLTRYFFRKDNAGRLIEDGSALHRWSTCPGTGTISTTMWTRPTRSSLVNNTPFR